ncbi:MAG: hypothetical protein ACI9OD_000937, partial [Limisphaerales bacterium]
SSGWDRVVPLLNNHQSHCVTATGAILVVTRVMNSFQIHNPKLLKNIVL